MYHVEEAEAVIVLRKDIAETAFSRAQFMASRWTYLFSNSLQLQTSVTFFSDKDVHLVCQISSSGSRSN